jgi:hypothetical protein
MRDFVLQGGGKVIDVPGCDVDRCAILEKTHVVAADGVAADLEKQSMDGVRIKFLRGESHNLA